MPSRTRLGAPSPSRLPRCKSLPCGGQEVQHGALGNEASTEVFRLRLPTRWTCGVRGIGQVAKLPAARGEVCLPRAFGSGTVRQRLCRQECGLEVTVREQQKRRMKHENGEGEMERCGALQTPLATQGKCVRKMCVRHGVCVHPPSHTQ